MLDNETITFRVTKIDGQSYPDDYTLTWRGLRIGRIRKSPGLPAHVDQWSWGCNVYGQPSHRFGGLQGQVQNRMGTEMRWADRSEHREGARTAAGRWSGERANSRTTG
jgi:hypothetical protein